MSKFKYTHTLPPKNTHTHTHVCVCKVRFPWRYLTVIWSNYIISELERSENDQARVQDSCASCLFCHQPFIKFCKVPCHWPTHQEKHVHKHTVMYFHLWKIGRKRCSLKHGNGKPILSRCMSYEKTKWAWWMFVSFVTPFNGEQDCGWLVYLELKFRQSIWEEYTKPPNVIEPHFDRSWSNVGSKQNLIPSSIT